MKTFRHFKHSSPLVSRKKNLQKQKKLTTIEKRRESTTSLSSTTTPRKNFSSLKTKNPIKPSPHSNHSLQNVSPRPIINFLFCFLFFLFFLFFVFCFCFLFLTRARVSVAAWPTSLVARPTSHFASFADFVFFCFFFLLFLFFLYVNLLGKKTKNYILRLLLKKTCVVFLQQKESFFFAHLNDGLVVAILCGILDQIVDAFLRIPCIVL